MESQGAKAAPKRPWWKSGSGVGGGCGSNAGISGNNEAAAADIQVGLCSDGDSGGRSRNGPKQTDEK